MRGTICNGPFIHAKRRNLGHVWGKHALNASAFCTRKKYNAAEPNSKIIRIRYLNSSFEWDPPSKKAEFFDSLSRFVLTLNSTSNIMAYVMFRFEYEEGERILYWWAENIHLMKLFPRCNSHRNKAMNCRWQKSAKGRDSGGNSYNASVRLGGTFGCRKSC